jgi:hypothetical protein
VDHGTGSLDDQATVCIWPTDGVSSRPWHAEPSPGSAALMSEESAIDCDRSSGRVRAVVPRDLETPSTLTAREVAMFAVDPDGSRTSKSAPKRMQPADRPTARELRRRRDLVWLYLANLGMSPTEIERACMMASRSRWQISRRIDSARRAQERNNRLTSP